MALVTAIFNNRIFSREILTSDHLNSSILILDDTGGDVNREEYYPFGETSFGSYAKKRYRFCGKELDEESGLYYYGMRYYSAWTCRFISVDPLAAQTPGLSPYCYANCNPVMMNDPTGGSAEGAGGGASGGGPGDGNGFQAVFDYLKNTVSGSNGPNSTTSNVNTDGTIYLRSNGIVQSQSGKVLGKAGDGSGKFVGSDTLDSQLGVNKDNSGIGLINNYTYRNHWYIPTSEGFQYNRDLMDVPKIAGNLLLGVGDAGIGILNSFIHDYHTVNDSGFGGYYDAVIGDFVGISNGVKNYAVNEYNYTVNTPASQQVSDTWYALGDASQWENAFNVGIMIYTLKPSTSGGTLSGAVAKGGAGKSLSTSSTSLVLMDEELLMQGVAQERIGQTTQIGNYLLRGHTEGLVGNTYSVNILYLEATQQGLGGFNTFINTIEMNAKASGASNISIYGGSVINKGLLNSNAASRYGYSITHTNSGAIFYKTF